MWRTSFMVAAVILFGIACSFGTANPYREVHGGTNLNGPGAVAANVAVASNNVAGLASFGFAIAGGLSLLAAAKVDPKS